MDQTSNRPPNSDYDPLPHFFWCKFGFVKCFGTSSWTNRWASHSVLPCKIHLLHITIGLRNDSLLYRIRADDTSKWQIFPFVVISQGTHLLSFYTFPNMLQIPNIHKMVKAESLSNFSGGCKRISFDDTLSWSLSTSHGWALCFSFSRLSFPLQNLLNHHCTLCLLTVSRPSA